MATRQGFSVSIYIPYDKADTFEMFKKLLPTDENIAELQVKNPKKLVSIALQRYISLYVDKYKDRLIKKNSQPITKTEEVK